MSKIQPWVFDHDGTLVDSFQAIVEATNETLLASGFEPVSAEIIKQNMIRATLPRFAFHTHLELHEPIVRQMGQEFYTRLHKVALKLTRVYEGWREVLDTLTQRHHPLAVLSNNEGRLIRRILTEHQVIHYFPLILGEEDISAVKPSPESLLAMARFWNVAPKNITMVGDSASDFNAARAAGCRAIGVCWGAHSRKELEPMGWDYLVDDPRELLELKGIT